MACAAASWTSSSSRGTARCEHRGRVLDAVAQRRVAATATVVSHSRGLPIELGEKLLIVDGTVKSGSFAWAALQARVLADAPACRSRRVSRTRARTVRGGRRSPAGGQVSVFFDLAVPNPDAGRRRRRPRGRCRSRRSASCSISTSSSSTTAPRSPTPSGSRTPSEIIVDDFSTALDSSTITPSTYVVLVTRAHTYDVHALRKLVSKPAGYIGMIGSRRRVYAVFKLLHEEGVPLDDLLRVHAPIGLDIKTETPGEIADQRGCRDPQSPPRRRCRSRCPTSCGRSTATRCPRATLTSRRLVRLNAALVIVACALGVACAAPAPQPTPVPHGPDSCTAARPDRLSDRATSKTRSCPTWTT